MDERIFNAACSGDVSILHQLLQENPFILSDYSHMINISKENPLTLAIKGNHLIFVREILKVNAQLAMELNRDGVSPLDVASAYGYVDIVAELLDIVGPKICRNPGRDGRTALHYAAVNGRVEFIDQLVSACSDSVKDVTSFGETALHLAVKCFEFEALRKMLQWIENVDDLKEVVNWGDKLGNTVLHYAASRKQLESVELLLDWNNRAGNILDLNAMNKKGLTAIDIAEVLINSSSTDDHVQLMRETLQHARGSTTIPSSDQILIVSERPTNDEDRDHCDLPKDEKPKKFRDMVELFQFKWGRDSIGEARSTLLIVIALISTITFQAGINPPNMFDPKDINAKKFSKMLFLVSNTIAFSTSVAILDYLAGGLPFQKQLRVSMFTMGGAYGSSVANIKPKGAFNGVLLLIILIMPYILRFLAKIIYMKKKGGNRSRKEATSATINSGGIRTHRLVGTNGGATTLGIVGSLDPNQF